MLRNDRESATDVCILSLTAFIENLFVSFLDSVSFRLLADLFKLRQKCDLSSVDFLKLSLGFVRDLRIISVKERM